MMRALAALDRADAAARRGGQDLPGLAAGPRDWAPPVSTAPRRSRPAMGRRQAVPIAVFAACLVGGPWVVQHAPGLLLPGAGPAPGSAHGPPPGAGAADQPLGTPPAPPAGTGGYTFAHTQSDSDEPTTWDPCREIRYVVAGTPPAGAETAVTEAVAQLEAASGFVFVDAGSTDERTSDADREPYQPDRYGEQWAPLLIDWTTPDAVPGLAGNIAGLGGGQVLTAADGRSTYVTGTVMLDTPQLADGLAAFAAAGDPRGAASVRAVVMHEIAHALGLDHVNDPGQLMYPESRVFELGNGDRRGLAALGRGECAPGL